LKKTKTIFGETIYKIITMQTRPAPIQMNSEKKVDFKTPKNVFENFKKCGIKRI
jgi:hypothetical protein